MYKCSFGLSNGSQDGIERVVSNWDDVLDEAGKADEFWRRRGLRVTKIWYSKDGEVRQHEAQYP